MSSRLMNIGTEASTRALRVKFIEEKKIRLLRLEKKLYRK